MEQAESSSSAAAALIFRNDDPFTQALRDTRAVDINDIARLNRALPPAHDGLSSLETSSAHVFSTQDNSINTKPTSIGTRECGPVYKSKGKATISYASSLSVAYGSGSEAELEQRAAHRDTLLAVGGWAQCDILPPEPLKGSARAQKRNHLQPKQKKPPVVLHHGMPTRNVLDYDDHEPLITVTPANSSRAKSCLRQRSIQHDDYLLGLADEEQPADVIDRRSAVKSLPLTRQWICAGIVALILITVSLSIFGTHHYGKAQMAHVKMIIFITMVFVAFLTVAAMITVRRALQEAMLAGLLEIVVGFALLTQLNDFM